MSRTSLFEIENDVRLAFASQISRNLVEVRETDVIELLCPDPLDLACVILDLEAKYLITISGNARTVEDLVNEIFNEVVTR